MLPNLIEEKILRSESYVADKLNELDKQLLVKFDEIKTEFDQLKFVRDKLNPLKKMSLDLR